MQRFTSLPTRQNRWICLPIAALISAVSLTAVADEPPPAQPGRPDPELIKTVRKVQELVQQNKLEEAAKLVDDTVKQRPKDANFLLAAATLVQQIAFTYIEDQNDRAKANPHLYAVARYMRQFHKLRGGKIPPQVKAMYATAIYNEACSLAVEGKKQKALDVLEEAVKAGFDEYDVIKDDADFQSLRDDKKYKEKFEELVEKVRNNKPKSRVRT